MITLPEDFFLKSGLIVGYLFGLKNGMDITQKDYPLDKKIFLVTSSTFIGFFGLGLVGKCVDEFISSKYFAEITTLTIPPALTAIAKHYLA